MGVITYPIVCRPILPAMLSRGRGTKSFKKLFYDEYGKALHPLDRKYGLKKKGRICNHFVAGIPLLKVRFLLPLLLVVFIYSLMQPGAGKVGVV